ncbi:MAG: sugar phosphate isomerase/epimerase [Planctomycetes bacterium]|nr:sugar phosphate isomerase/epimerase [Planctomycetota bacterium]
MSLKTAFTAAVTPECPLDALISKSQQWGFDGLALSDIQPEVAASLARHAAAIRTKLSDARQTLVAIASGARFGCLSERTMERRADQVRQTIQLAAALGCEFVIVGGDHLPDNTIRERAILQAASVLRELAREAGRQHVTLLLENGGDFASHRDIWSIWDSVSSPALRLCWNPLTGRPTGEVASTAITCLAASLSLVHMSDARFNGQAQPIEYTRLGEGELEIARCVNLLRGLCRSAWLCVHWPDNEDGAPGPAQRILPAAAEFLRAELDKPTVALSAYKDDKNAPRFVSRAPAEAESA